MSASTSYLLMVYGVALEVDTAPFGSPSWAPLCDGFNNLAEALNEQVQEYFFLCGKGWGTDEVTGMHPAITVTGVRKIGDPAQDFIFGQKYALMAGRKTNLRYSTANADGTVTRITVRATMKDISSFGGNTTDGAAVSATFSFNGPPQREVVAASETLTVTSAAGAAVGDTVITVVPTFPDAGCKYVYATGTTAPAAAAGTVLTGWNDFGNGATYKATGGDYVTVAMVNVSTYKVVGSGTATIVAKTT